MNKQRNKKNRTNTVESNKPNNNKEEFFKNACCEFCFACQMQMENEFYLLVFGGVSGLSEFLNSILILKGRSENSVLNF